MNVLVMLPATNGVLTATSAGGSNDAWPLTPAQRLPSGMITAADTPGMLLAIRMRSSVCWRSAERPLPTALGDAVGVTLGEAEVAVAVGLGLAVGVGSAV